ncbi:NAD(P)-binding protein [Parathielavia appendiculata]|uniref:NAD(P)-binding protein n=1 Tax=Parathielavia appendiculata TaxID=2587402 RepID=A0AAN6Z5W9_9PEZI|nr:NAD(P)-binding protein [Parathielavia appendiculata]
MTLTVLTDNQIRSLLENLTVAELEGFRVALASALHEHSTGIQGDTPIHQQPERVSIHNTTTGATTLFMPSCSSAGHGIKVITLSSAANQSPTPAPPTITTTTIGNNNANAITTPSTSTSKPVIPPTGAITLFTPHGTPLGLLHARTLTAFRTALASLCLVQRRTAPIKTLVAFGCGEQAYWHVRLTLLSRAHEVQRVVFVNRRVSEGFRKVVERLKSWREEGCEFMPVTRDEEGYEERVAQAVREADVVFCCTPSTEPLFDGRVLLGGAEEKGRLIVAIGSYTPEMREMPRELIERAVSGEGGEGDAGVVVVDTIDGALKEAGELIETSVRPEQLVELGEIVMLKRADNNTVSTKKGHLAQWLQTGNVIYKSVGVGLMDLSIGMHIIQFAKEKGVGTHVQGF